MLGLIEAMECVAACADPLPLHCCFVQSGLQSCSTQADVTYSVVLIEHSCLCCGISCVLVCLAVACALAS